MSNDETLKDRLSQVSAQGTPALRSFARWLLDNLSVVAFSSIRGLAKQAGVNPNTVTRMAKELGYTSFDAFRTDVQATIQTPAPNYGARAQTLRHEHRDSAFAALMEAHGKNTAMLFSADIMDTLNACIDPLLGARKVYVVGVRSCYAIAHYFSYVGGMAFSNFVDCRGALSMYCLRPRPRILLSGSPMNITRQRWFRPARSPSPAVRGFWR